MYLSVDFYVLRKQFGDERGFEILRDTGFTAVDYSYFGWEESDPILGDNWREYALKTRELMEKYGIVCDQCHAPFAYQYGEPMEMTCRNYRDIVRSIQAAAVLGADHITVHGLYLPEGAESEKAWKANLDFFRSIEPVCAEAGIRAAVENLPLYVTERPELLDKLLDELDSPWFAPLIDTGHSTITGVKPDVFVRSLRHQPVCGLHVQDMHGKKDEHIVPYMGEIDWDAFTCALRECAYPGSMSLEIIHFMEHNPPELLPEAHRYAAAVGKRLIRMTESAK